MNGGAASCIENPRPGGSTETISEADGKILLDEQILLILTVDKVNIFISSYCYGNYH